MKKAAHFEINLLKDDLYRGLISNEDYEAKVLVIRSNPDSFFDTTVTNFNKEIENFNFFLTRASDEFNSKSHLMTFYSSLHTFIEEIDSKNNILQAFDNYKTDLALDKTLISLYKGINSNIISDRKTHLKLSKDLIFHIESSVGKYMNQDDFPKASETTLTNKESLFSLHNYSKNTINYTLKETLNNIEELFNK